MAQITNYSTLKDAFTNWRADGGLLSARYDEAIQLFQDDANNRLRTRQMETSTTLTVASGSASLPSDYLIWRTVLWTGTTPYIELEYAHPAYLDKTWIKLDSGWPKIFTIEGSTFKIRPNISANDGAFYEFHYYQSIPDLIANSTNWLCTAHPTSYLWGGLYYLDVIANNEERAAIWQARMEAELQEIMQVDAAQRAPTSPLVREDSYY